MAKKFKNAPIAPALFGDFLVLIGVSPEDFVAAVWAAAREAEKPLTRRDMDFLSGTIKLAGRDLRQRVALEAVKAAGFDVKVAPFPALTGGSRRNVIVVTKKAGG